MAVVVLAILFLVKREPGGEKGQTPVSEEEEMAIELSKQNVEALVQIAEMDLLDSLGYGADQYDLYLVVKRAVQSYNAAKEDMGEYLYIEDAKAKCGKKKTVVNVTIRGSKKDAVMKFVYGEEMQPVTSITIKVCYTFWELIMKYLLHIVLCVGVIITVSVVIVRVRKRKAAS